MKFSFVTLFPDLCRSAMQTGVVGRGVEKGLIEVETVDLRDFSLNNYGSVDDTPYGGGPGMVMRPEPIVNAVESLELKPKHKILMMTPTGKPFNQSMAKSYSELDEVVMICGRYEGIDERVKSVLDVEEVSIGDYVLSGGELAALTMADATSRLVQGVLGDPESIADESFQNNTLEYPQYTKPRNYRGHDVPEVLLSGHHEAIQKWREEASWSVRTSPRPFKPFANCC